MILTKEIVLEKNLIDENGHCIIPEGYTRIKDSAFFNCTGLYTINFPNSMKYIERRAFWNCNNLNLVKLPKSVKTIGINAFGQCRSLKLIELPDVKTIKGFKSCENLESVNLSNTTDTIDDYAFVGCTGLKSINISKFLKKVGHGSFKNCTSLPKIGVGKEILEIALKDDYFKRFIGLPRCFSKIVSELILKYRKPICLEVELPMFTQENAVLHENGTGRRDSEKNFLEWMLSEVKNIKVLENYEYL